MTEEMNTETPPSFGIEDLVFTLQVYEACTQRGAFKAEELSNVGAVYDRLKAFLIANEAIIEPGSATFEAPTGEE